MPVDPRSPSTTAEQQLAHELADMKRRIAALEQLVQRLIQGAP